MSPTISSWETSAFVSLGLRRFLVADPVFERGLTWARRWFLQAGASAERYLSLLCTLARYCFLTEYALALFARGQRMAAERGLILVDTKYEFGTDASGRIVLADEIHTPDSSRYWFQDSYQSRFEAGARPDSFDKDVMRAWVAARCDPYKDPIPAIPSDIVLETAQVYIAAFERITGQPFSYPDPSESVLARIRRNLADCMG